MEKDENVVRLAKPVIIRQCALDCAAFGQLKHVYENREEIPAKLRANGVKVIGKMGCDVPDELIVAGGMLPVQIYADLSKELKETDVYLEYAFDPMVRAQFEKIVDGTYFEQVDALAISNSTDVIIRIYLYLRELHRVEPEKAVPEVEFIDWLFTRKPMHAARNELIMKLFWEAVERWAGRAVTEEQVLEAAKLCNANKAALRRVQALRRECRISGCEALVIIGAGFFMEKAVHTELVNAVADAAAKWPVIDAPKVFFTGSNQEDTSIYEKIEGAGLLVVGEDHDWGERVFDRDFNMDLGPIRGLVDCYMLREFSSKKAFVSQRVEALDREVTACGAEGVIFYTNQYEEAASWDYPSQKESLEAAGKKTLGLFKMLWPCERNEGLEEAFAGLAEAMKASAEPQGEPEKESTKGGA